MESNNEITKTEETGMVVSEAPQAPVTVIGSNAEKLSDIIMSNIELIQKDPSKIPQAEAINNQLKTLIDLGKAQIEGMKVAAFLAGR